MNQNSVTTTDRRLSRVGYLTFLLSGVCAISSGVIVSLLKEQYGFNFSLTGTLLSALSIGNMIAGFVAGILSSKIGMRASILLLALGYPIGYGLMAFFGIPGVLLMAFLLAGFAKGSVMNTCTVLVGQHTPDRARGMTLMHACYSFGALLCPFLITFLAKIGSATGAALSVAAAGLGLWLIYALGGLPGRTPAPASDSGLKRTPDSAAAKAARSDFAFLRSADFWILTALLFCQNAAEQSVNGWLVTYFKDQNILTGALAAYTVSIMWGATLAGRLVIAFALKIRNIFRSLIFMSLGCLILYVVLIQQTAAIPAVLALFAFAAAMSGINPLTVAAVGQDLSPASAGVLLPVAGIGAILMPWLIGIVGDAFGLRTGMAMNLIPCAGLLILSAIMFARKKGSGT